ncbi:TauD/TfdA family dioxygenase [Streptomyces sp. JH002]|uniref:TauD/TfdA family dioxygenase n=1 Tax=Streptomyces sp. JH002 TaxID=2763259 RepID=UPI003D805542
MQIIGEFRRADGFGHGLPHFLEHGGTRLPVVDAGRESDDLLDWIGSHITGLRELITRHGAVRITGPRGPQVTDLAAVASLLGGTSLAYTERSTPRSRVSESVYTSTEYPAEEHIPQHNESSYSATWPDHLFFLSVVPADEGGATPVADSRVIRQNISPDLLERFTRLGVRYTRAYHEGIGLSWQEAFQATNRAEVDGYCREHGIDAEWEGDLLRTSQRRPAVLDHPVTGETVWFNQAHLFHVSALPKETAAALLGLFEARDLPRNATYGDGTPISDADIEEINDAFGRSCVAAPWERGEVMVLDNVLASHGRLPYRGERKTLVTMTAADWRDWARSA